MAGAGLAERGVGEDIAAGNLPYCPLANLREHEEYVQAQNSKLRHNVQYLATERERGHGNGTRGT